MPCSTWLLSIVVGYLLGGSLLTAVWAEPIVLGFSATTYTTLPGPYRFSCNPLGMFAD
jgi:hypothetical protein